MKRQDWTVGQTVKVGFLSLTVTARETERPDKYLPYAYRLVDARGREYRFTPYNGLERA